eukprot:6890717-Prymnesium_polylepis.1
MVAGGALAPGTGGGSLARRLRARCGRARSRHAKIETEIVSVPLHQHTHTSIRQWHAPQLSVVMALIDQTPESDREAALAIVLGPAKLALQPLRCSCVGRHQPPTCKRCQDDITPRRPNMLQSWRCAASLVVDEAPDHHCDRIGNVHLRHLFGGARSDGREQLDDSCIAWHEWRELQAPLPRNKQSRQ